MNHVHNMYGVMDEVFKFTATFREFPPRSVPPSFNPANIMEQTLDDLKTKKMLKEGIDPERIRGGVQKMIEKQLQDRGTP
jgi:arylsulfatase